MILRDGTENTRKKRGYTPKNVDNDYLQEMDLHVTIIAFFLLYPNF